MEIVWQSKAVKQLRKLGDRSVQQRILMATRTLADFPACPNIKAMVDHRYTHRFRVGDWRLLLVVQEEANLISIEEIKKRDERTY
ncbi:type II toxin-antitoxin system RelE family toxin [Geomonas anaerohicana]|uniref:Type II toxin-antitoxin system RelE/ParE family toxin n=1 Tax=Geomonas anaerohicana TaxID=2798583 RepID=A0ABS0YAA8_9BACT|nr:type II toxin-antitoxin system RelE/ParE family toxin [Geomonas anaerohicana]MBJ6749227.1 type II toxin-antitoxin system RelE/ParE family toxin [Geomonas anaerohicana]